MLHTPTEHYYHTFIGNVYGQGYSEATGLYGDNVSALRSAFGQPSYYFLAAFGENGLNPWEGVPEDLDGSSGGPLPLSETEVTYLPLSRFA